MYTLDYFIDNGYFEPKPAEEVEFEMQGGHNIAELLSPKLRKRLSTVGGSDYNGDFSRQDSAIITAILAAGYTPADAYMTFMASLRGKDCIERKAGHVEDYVERTIRKAISFLKTEDKSTAPDRVKIDFSGGETTESAEGKEDGIVSVKASDVVVEKTHWLWKPYIPQGKITVLAGDPGMGKSTIVNDLISRITRGTYMPFGLRTVSGVCAIASAEDAANDTITPRLIAAEAKLEKVHIIRKVIIAEEEHFLTLPRDVNRLQDFVTHYGARLLIIDPLSAFLERGTDSHKDQDIRSVLAPLEAMAEKTKVAVLIVAHFNKREDASMLYRVGASIGLVGAARSVLGVAKTPKDGTSVLFHAKSNLDRMGKAISYETRSKRVTKQETKREWKGEDVVESSTIRWRAEVDFDPNQQTFMTESQAENEAEGFLRQLLVDGELPADEIFAEARKAGIPKGQLTRVKSEIGVVLRRKGQKWFWKLPSASD